MATAMPPTPTTPGSPIDKPIPILKENEKYHCFIAYSFKEQDIADKIRDYLLGVGFKVCIAADFTLGQALIDNITHGMESSRRVIALLSKDYLESDWFDHETLLMIHNNQTHQRQMIIPVNINLEEEQLKSTRLGVYSYQYLNYKGSDYDLYRIAQSVAGDDIPLQVCLPCGNVAQGLVWAYYYGYLKLILPELKTRCDASELSREKNIKIVPQVFILVPDNGLCHSTITDCDPKITEIGHLDPVLRNRAGVINRPYKNTIYRVEGPGGKVYYAPVEYATPILSMFEMCEEGISGLPEEEKRHQIRNFKDMLNQVLSHSKAATEGTRFSFRIIYFQAGDDGRSKDDPVSSKIIATIEQEDATMKTTRDQFAAASLVGI